mgnify:CR=1 FL=1
MMLGKKRSRMGGFKPRRRTPSSLTRKRRSGAGILFVAALLLISAVVLGIIDYSRFNAEVVSYPKGSSIGGVPVGGLSRKAAAERLQEAFALPVELVFQGARIQFNPDAFGFEIKIDESLEYADSQNEKASWFSFLFGKVKQPIPFTIPIKYVQNPTTIHQTLKAALVNRYERAATETHPLVNSANVIPGESGTELANVDEAITHIGMALTSATQRTVVLNVKETPPMPMSRENLETKLRQTIQLEAFNGLVEVYLQDLQNGQVMHFATRGGKDLPVDVAYSGASTVKIPIMVSTMRRVSEPIPGLAKNWMRAMIQDSLNPPADGLMKNYMNNTTGPLVVTEDMQELGYQNTFLAGFFELGAPLLRTYETPANQRSDINLKPDLYNQTVPSEIGDLLARIYRCAKYNAPEYTLFNGEVTHEECQIMVENLLSNRMGALIEVGVALEGSVAHKHGWTNALDGLIHSISDVGIVYSPGGDYVLVIFIHSSDQLLFEDGNLLFARLSQSIYNAYNPLQQAIVYTE